MSVQSINPYNQDLIGEYNKVSLKDESIVTDLEEKIQKAANLNRYSNFSERGLLLKKVASDLLTNKEEYSKLISNEMGKLQSEAVAEIEKCAWACTYYADEAEEMLKDKELKSDGSISKIVYQPLGAVLAVMPWNFPFWQVFRFAAPALMAGNVCVLKHASNVTGCALAIENIFKKAGWAEGSFTTLVLDVKEVPLLIEKPFIKAVTLTGSEYAGSQVASYAGLNIKKAVLELGGSDPFVIWPDCDLNRTIQKAIQSRFLNAGQSCIAAKRFIIHESIYDEFKTRLLEAVKDLPFASKPSDEGLAPLVSLSAKKEICCLVNDAISKGATCLIGGDDEDITNAFYPATVLDNISVEAKLYHEEAFGPVMSLYKVSNIDEAIILANETRFGLGSSIWTKEQEVIDKFVENVAAGAVFVNEMVKSDPRLPFGGIKYSGYGRELAREGILEFVNTKTVYIN